MWRVDGSVFDIKLSQHDGDDVEHDAVGMWVLLFLSGKLNKKNFSVIVLF